MLSSTTCGIAATVRDGLEVEAVAGMDLEAERRAVRGGAPAGARARAALAAVVAVDDRLAIGAGVQLDHRRAEVAGRLHRPRSRAR